MYSSQKIAGFIVIGALLTGCASPGARMQAINKAAAPTLEKKREALKNEMELVKADTPQRIANAPGGPPRGVTPSLVNSRLETYERIQREKDEMDTKVSVIFGVNEATAKNVARVKTGIGISGIAAGIAAAALIAASPANAVWVAVFSGFAGGVAGMNTVFDNNGYSREQISALETSVVQQYATASKDINLGVLFAKASDPATTVAQWIEELDKQERALTQLKALALTLRIPLGPAPAK